MLAWTHAGGVSRRKKEVPRKGPILPFYYG